MRNRPLRPSQGPRRAPAPSRPRPPLPRPLPFANCLLPLFRSPPLPIAYCLLPLFLLSLPACVQRQIRVTSTPPGARVLLNDREIGVTPVEARFTFYGGYDIQLLLPGYEPVHALRHAKAPLYEYPGPDLIATALPLNLNNTIEWHFDLTPVPEAADPEGAREGLLDRAADLRERALSDAKD